ncbi:AMP-binding protein [Variovorax sp. PBL-E5]|uniref:AMP-binding protein n=1 Tax=Variovorax sp. PBL-E5 TaxID=434014 RepID=UPI001315C87A|nr:AMP-binding protein [Variovorax sp. PBL-E5]VTU30683.1 Long-chain-fatty-acid--CoA ligase [Variovorax sp. PBL-E5]
MRRDVRLSESFWAADASQQVWELSLGGLLRQLAREVPERTALVEGTPEPAARRRWTYRQLLDSAETVARALLRRFEPGERVAVWSANSAEWVLLQHGAAMAGLVLVTINPAYLASELRHVLATSRAAGIFHSGRYRGNDMSAMLAGLRAELPELREVFCFSEWPAFVASSDPAIELPVVDPASMIQIQFTSGTTGKPKGACLHHRGVVNASRFGAMRVGFPEGGVWVSAMPLFHVGGCAGSELGAFSQRGTFVMQPAFDAAVMLALIESERGNHVHAVPTMLVALLDHPERPKRDLRSLGTFMSGGSTVPANLVRHVCETFSAKLTITFGQTELNGVICQTFPDDPPQQQASTIGQPAPCMEVKIADPATGRVLPLDTPGEIWARGYQTMLGYFDMPEGADGALTPDGWLKTGDQATMDAEGYLRITGRLKDAIIRGGENIYPREIEEVLCAHPAISQASVIGLPDEKWGEVVAAVLRLQPDASPVPATEELHAWCRARLAAYKTPVRWFYVDAFPLTASGKIQKFALRDMIGDARLVPEPFVKPETGHTPRPRADQPAI